MNRTTQYLNLFMHQSRTWAPSGCTGKKSMNETMPALVTALQRPGRFRSAKVAGGHFHHWVTMSGDIWKVGWWRNAPKQRVFIIVYLYLCMQPLKPWCIQPSSQTAQLASIMAHARVFSTLVSPMFFFGIVIASTCSSANPPKKNGTLHNWPQQIVLFYIYCDLQCAWDSDGERNVRDHWINSYIKVVS